MSEPAVSLFEAARVTTAAPPRPPPSFIARKIRELECEIEDLEQEVEWARDRLDELREVEETWPDKPTLLAVYGAPGNWPVEAA